MSSFKNVQERCIERTCAKLFTITAGEQEFYHQKGFTLPKRCPECRQKRRAEKEKQAA